MRIKENAIGIKHLRSAGNTKWDRVSNELIREITEQNPTTTKIEKGQLHWYGHIMRMNTDRPTRKIFELDKSRNRQRGSPKGKWKDSIKEPGRRRKTQNEMKN